MANCWRASSERTMKLLSGGAPDRINNVENVFLEKPAPRRRGTRISPWWSPVSSATRFRGTKIPNKLASAGEIIR
jgi:hypothetical protein